MRDLPGRPPVAEYLHGIEDENKRETAVAWREEVALFDGTAATEEQIAELLDAHPIRAHETLRTACTTNSRHSARSTRNCRCG